jgi:hypothetical protein
LALDQAELLIFIFMKKTVTPEDRENEQMGSFKIGVVHQS